MEAGEDRIDMGRDQLDGRIILISAPASGEITVDGRTGTGLVAGVWSSYIDENLQHELEAGMVESYRERRGKPRVLRAGAGLKLVSAA